MNKQQMNEQFKILMFLLHTTAVPIPNFKDWDKEFMIVAEAIDNNKVAAETLLVALRDRFCAFIESEMNRISKEKTNKLRQAQAELKQTSPSNN